MAYRLRTQNSLYDHAKQKRVPFNALPRESRERFCEATKDAEFSLAICELAPRRRRIVTWFRMFILVAMAVLLGSLNSTSYRRFPFFDAHSTIWFQVASCFVLGILIPTELRYWCKVLAMPFRRGRYVFSADLVIANCDEIVIIPMHQVETFRLLGKDECRNGAMLEITLTDKERHFFRFTCNSAAEHALDQLEREQTKLSEAIRTRDLPTIHRLDPFYEARTQGMLENSNQLSSPPKRPKDPYSTPQPPSWLRPSLLLTLVCTAAPFPLHLARRYAHDVEKLAAIKNGDIPSYQMRDYIEYQGLDYEEVEDVHLPAAMAREAVASRDLEKMQEVLRVYPDHKQTRIVRQALKKHFDRAQSNIARDLRSANDERTALVKSLYEWSRASSHSPLPLLVIGTSEASVDRLDAAAKAIAAEVVLPGAPIRAMRSDQVSNTIAFSLERAFKSVFDKEVLTLDRVNARSDEDYTKRVHLQVTLDYRASQTLHTYQKTRSKFLGFEIKVGLTLKDPANPEARPAQFVLRTPNQVHWTTFNEAPDSSDIYQALLDRTLLQLQRTIPAETLDPKTPRYRTVIEYPVFDQRDAVVFRNMSPSMRESFLAGLKRREALKLPSSSEAGSRENTQALTTTE